jgi:hypothetical protein
MLYHSERPVRPFGGILSFWEVSPPWTIFKEPWTTVGDGCLVPAGPLLHRPGVYKEKVGIAERILYRSHSKRDSSGDHRGAEKGNGAFDPAKISELVPGRDELPLSRSSG